MDLQPLYTLLEKGEPAQRAGVPSKVRRQRAHVIYQAAKKVKDKVQRGILHAIATAIEDGDPRMACTMFGKLSPEGRKALPRNLAIACGEWRERMSEQMDRMYALLEARPGPHWNPWPQKKSKSAELGKSLEDLARFATKYPENSDWSKKTVDLVANIGWAIKKDDTKKVKKLLPLLVKQGETSQGLVNDIKNWLDFGEA
jgi:hypothetical protein